MRDGHRKGRKQYVNFLPLLIDSVKTSVRHGIAPGNMIAVVGKLFAGREPRCFTDNLVSFDHQLTAVRMSDDPFTSE